MPAPTSTYQTNLSRREEMAVSGAAMSDAPWKLAAGTGVVVAGADMLMHLALFHFELFAPLSWGAVVFFAVAGAGALVRSRKSRALRWARSRPWRFAAAPGIAAAIVVFVLSVIDHGGMLGSVWTGLWHGAVAYAATGAVGTLVRPRREESA
jgi:hypothetical protein